MTAVISDCGVYRYHLRREISNNPQGASILFIGVNPSTADASRDDATVRKWRGFSERWGFDCFEVANLFAYRATDVNQLATCADPVGPENNDYLERSIRFADLVVPCWGSRVKLPPRLYPRIEEVKKMLRDRTGRVSHFGLTASGDPKHPLMLGYETKLTAWGELYA